jgi:hypothetical protein
MSLQAASTIAMIRPSAFGYNPQTAANNYFQQSFAQLSPRQIQKLVCKEFDGFVNLLINHNIEVLIFEDTSEPSKPDAIFPNNWFSTSSDGIISVFPMYATNRRCEKRLDILRVLAEQFRVRDIVDWSEFEAEGFYLEGTGSMVMDHDRKIIYASISERTHISLLEKFARYHQYTAIAFHSADEAGKPIYHTNVLMCIGEKFASICDGAIEDENERVAVLQLLRTTGHDLVLLTFAQLHAFAGNMLEVKNKKGNSYAVMSKQAYDYFSKEQLDTIDKYCTPLPVEIPTIEAIGGGSVRCMMAEIFLQRRMSDE